MVFSSELLSRLKGIETVLACRITSVPRFGTTFPFEGNWNLWVYTHRFAGFVAVRNYFPVWRELKQIPDAFITIFNRCSELLSRLKGIETLFMIHPVFKSLFGTTFPFEGNWNWNAAWDLPKETEFGTTFPFEGNWNINNHLLILIWKPFGTTFPFEGNWNSDILLFLYCCYNVRNYFPVWRELKHNLCSILTDAMFPCSELLSRLKGIET